MNRYVEHVDQALEEHGLQVMRTVGLIVGRLGDLPGLLPYLQDLTARHIKVRPAATALLPFLPPPSRNAPTA